MNDIFHFPGAASFDPAVEEWLYNQAQATGAPACHWFKLMRTCGADVRELMHDGHPTACVGDAAFAYVDVFTAHASVGFYFGAELKDPAGLLEGSGKRMRHVKLKPGRAIDARALTALIRSAYRDMKQRLKKTGR